VLLRRIARPLFATWFITQGLSAVTAPADHVAVIRTGLTTLGARVPPAEGICEKVSGLSDAQLTWAVRAHSTTVALAGFSLALGRAPRCSAMTLALLTAPTVLTALPAPRSAKEPPEQRSARRARLVSALSGTGGALLAAADYEGRPGPRWRMAAARAARAEEAATATR